MKAPPPKQTPPPRNSTNGMSKHELRCLEMAKYLTSEDMYPTPEQCEAMWAIIADASQNSPRLKKLVALMYAG